MSPPAIFYTLLFEPELIIGLVRGLVCNFSKSKCERDKHSHEVGGHRHNTSTPIISYLLLNSLFLVTVQLFDHSISMCPFTLVS